MSFSRKAFLIIIGLVGLGLLAWLVYLNGNFSGLQARKTGFVVTSDYSPPPPTSNVLRPGPTTAAVSPARTEAINLQPLANSNLNELADPTNDGHYIDPDTEKAIKILLANNSNQADPSKIPLPPQFQPGQYNPLGPATIPYANFYYFLKQGNSPALPEALSLYNACLKLYCDPALALAFFEHESSMGRAGAGASNKSWGNIRCAPGFECRATSNNGSFKIYATWTDGLIDWVILMRETYATKWKLFSLEQIIPRYAPSADNNDPLGYINTLKKLVNKYRTFQGQS